MGRGLVALVVVVVVLALSGCATVQAPKPGLSDQERSEVRQFWMDRLWLFTGLPDDQRPPAPPMVEGSIQESNVAFVTCMNAAGFDNYRLIDDGGYSVDDDGEMGDDELLAAYSCRAGFWVDGDEGWYSDAQLSYLYDYYTEVLVPCMAAYGATVDYAPTREWFLAQHGGWHPFSSISEDDQERYFGNRATLVECPPAPPGIEDPGYSVFWEQQ